MKRFLCAVMAFITIICLTACGCENQELGNMVTVLVPEKITFTSSSGSGPVEINVVFEEGWESKDNFFVKYESTKKNHPFAQSVLYGNKESTQLHLNGLRVEYTYDERGNILRQIEYVSGYGGDVVVDRTFTYDTLGRILTEKVVGGEEPVQLHYRYDDTAEGSIGTAYSDTARYEVVYDENNRLVRTAVFEGYDQSSTVYTYDAKGSLISSSVYERGVLVSKTKTTYKAVRISIEKAQQLPVFKQDK